MKKIIFALLPIIAAITACRKPYYPPAIPAPNGYLVVEGQINSGSDSTVINLSRTVPLSSKISVKPELGATVAIQGDQNATYPLTEAGNGKYVCAGLNLDNTHNYRISIKAANGEQFLSLYQPVISAPPIDSVTFKVQNDPISGLGVNINVNAHDVTNTVHYFRWDFQETWVIVSNFTSYFYSNGDTVLGRNLATQNITDCWENFNSDAILVGSTAKLSHDVLSQYPLIAIPSTSLKLAHEYSIQVKQYALTPAAYDFYVNLKKITEQLGSIFDAQPSQLNGNIYSVNNPTEPVIGYISVGNTSATRIFITRDQIPPWPVPKLYPDSVCMLLDKCCFYDYQGANQVDYYINYLIGRTPNPLIPIDAIAAPGGPILGFTAAFRKCADCTLLGTNVQPAFWK